MAKSDRISGFHEIDIMGETWRVTRVLHPKAPEDSAFRMAITKAAYQLVTRGPSKGRKRMTLVVEYIEEE